MNLQQCRKQQAIARQVRYTKLSPRQAMLAMVEHNQKFSRLGNPFPTTNRKEAV